VLIHPGTAREEKFWPAAHWAALVDDLHHKYRVPIVLTGGNWEFERQHLAGILSATTVPILDLSGKLNLRQLAPVIAGARLAVTVDTAAMHLASSFCVPQIALFGPTNPFHWAPRHQGATVLQSGVPKGTPWRPKQAGAPMSGLAWETVAAAAHRWLVQG
jgi:ADP-heptose:LPS heptosyltransferase